MVKVLLVHNGSNPAHCVKKLLADSLQVELYEVRSVPEGKDRHQGIMPDIILIPLPERSDPMIHTITQWQHRCTSEGLHPGFLLFTVQNDSLTFFDITYGSMPIRLNQSDTGHQVISSIRQVVGRSRVERSLREDYDHHNRIICHMPLSCLDVDEGLISRTTPHFTQLSGFDESEILGKSPEYFISSDSASQPGDILLHLYHQKCIEGAITGKNGEHVPCRLTLHSKESGLPGDGLWFIEDRREYAVISSALRETEYECREQLYLSETLVIRLGPDGTISFVNPAAVRCFGYEPDELTGKSVGILFPSGTLQDVTNPVSLFLEVSDESSSAIHIFEHCKKNGNHLWIAWTSRGLYSSDNELTGIICIGTDMTEQASNGEERISTRVWRDRILSYTDISPEVFDAVLQACMEIGREGREGKTIGTSFLVGDSEEVLKRSRQLILNPFSGHPPEMRMVSVPDVREMLKEYALLDGAFVVTGDGILEAAGRYITLDTSAVSLPKGMGTRHSSVAALTGVTDAIGFVVSESGGKVSIMKKGKIVKVIA